MDKLHMITANGTVQWPRCNGKFYDKEIVDWANRLKLELLCGKARILSDKLFVTYSYTDCNDSLVDRPLGHIVDYHPFGYTQGFSEIHGVEFKFKNASSRLHPWFLDTHMFLESGVDYYYITANRYIKFVGKLMLDKKPLIVDSNGATARLVIPGGANGIDLKDLANIVGEVPFTYWEGPTIKTYYYRNEEDESEAFKLHISNELNEDFVPNMSDIVNTFLNCGNVFVPGLDECHGSLAYNTKDNTMMINHIYAGGKKRYGITDIFYQPKKRPVTIVKFTDGTVSVVKLKKGDKNDIRVAIMYAIMNHNNPHFNRDMKDLEDMVVVQDVSLQKITSVYHH